MRAVAESPASLVDELEGARNVLLLAPSLANDAGDACRSLLSAVPEDRADVLSVTFNDSPDARLEAWRSSGGPVDPANLGFVVVGDGVRSAAAVGQPGGGPGLPDVGPVIESVSSPGDLTGIGIKLGNFFEAWGDDGNDLLLCFHTLSTVLQYADHRTVYQFVHVVTGQVRVMGGRAHFHLDPTAHDQRTVDTLLGLFDAVVQANGGGAWEVKRRRA